MTLDECLKCRFNIKYENGAVHCTFGRNMVSMATVFDPKQKRDVLLACPRENDEHNKKGFFSR